MKSLIMYLRSPVKIINPLGARGYLNWMPDEMYLKFVFKGFLNKKLNLENPRSFSEKLQWLKLHDRKPEYSNYADKYEVRKHIAETIGEKYLIPLLGIYDCVDEIDWKSLPNKFVLKCAHGSTSNIICTDKEKLDIEASKIKLKKWMKKNWYWYGREWPYKYIKPRIICEKFISDKDTTPDDYKVLCFDGKAKLIEVHMDRFENHKQDFYDEKWNKKLISQGNTISDIVYPKPIELEKMIELSEKLAADMIHVRIDWFIAYNKLYFGEITFYDGSGFMPFVREEYDYLLGSWIHLPIDKIN